MSLYPILIYLLYGTACHLSSNTITVWLKQILNLITCTKPTEECIKHLGVKDIDVILPIPPQPEPTDPAVENASSLKGQNLVAFRNQNQMAHIDAHRAFMSSALVKNNPPTMAILQGTYYGTCRVTGKRRSGRRK